MTRRSILLFALALVPARAVAATRSVRDFGAVGDGAADDTGSFQRAADEGPGSIRLPAGRYRLTKTVTLDLDRQGPLSIVGEGAATIIMDAPGPAFRLVGTHGGTADPPTVEENVWTRQRMPLVDGFEILGANPSAIGLEFQGTMQATVTRVAVRRALHGILLTGRNRNVIVSECHLYDNRGAGLLLEQVNLHQINVSNCHISYNGGGGIVVRESEVRNLQVGTCDIESNMDPDGPPAANILIDVSKGTVREGAVTGCTLQHNHDSPGSANIRFQGRVDQPIKIGYFSIADNALSDVMINVHLAHVRGVSITGNSFWKGFQHDLLVEGSSNIVVGPNVFDRNPDYRPADSANGIVFRDSADCTLSGLHSNGSLAAKAAVLFERCRRVNVTGATVVNFRGAGVWFDRCRNSRLANSLIDSGQETGVAVKVTGGGDNAVASNSWAGVAEIEDGAALVANNLSTDVP